MARNKTGKFDYHVHSNFSPDAKNSMDEMCNRAIDLGLNGFAFTDHVDLGVEYTGGGMFAIADTKAYVKEIERMQAKYEGKLTILKGLEVGYSPNEWNDAKKYIDDVHPDFVIGSVHVVNSIDPYEARFFDGHDRMSVFKYYMTALISAIDHFKDNVQVVGHLNYLSKYSPFIPKEYVYIDDPKLWDKLLIKIIDCDLGIEVNTSGIDKCGSTIPGESVLARYFELGGRKLVFGSDAHTTENLLKHYDYTKKMIKSLGFDGFTDYSGDIK